MRCDRQFLGEHALRWASELIVWAIDVHQYQDAHLAALFVPLHPHCLGQSQLAAPLVEPALIAKYDISGSLHRLRHRLPLCRDDILRRSIIEVLMSHFTLSIESIETAHLIDF
jgi:hypothetical protein